MVSAPPKINGCADSDIMIRPEVISLPRGLGGRDDRLTSPRQGDRLSSHLFSTEPQFFAVTFAQRSLAGTMVFRHRLRVSCAVRRELMVKNFCLQTHHIETGSGFPLMWSFRDTPVSVSCPSTLRV